MSFHLYRINELYSNADGSVQFIEMAIGGIDFESFWAGQSIRVTQNATLHGFVFPSNLPSAATSNTTVLLATPGFAALGVVAPDFVIPPGFLFTNGGVVNFADADSIAYASLPTGGAMSLDRTGTASVATPRNFAGVTGTVPTNEGSNIGTPGDDLLAGVVGSETIDGGAGTDVLVLPGERANFTVSQDAIGFFSVTDELGVGGTDALLRIEALRFTDGQYSLVAPPRAAPPDYGKSTSFLLDQVYYLLANPDLAPTLAIGDAAQHYLTLGAAQGRGPNSWFDPDYYGSRWPDLAALALDDATLFMHLNLYGIWEGRSPGPQFDRFDGARYLAENPDVAVYVDANVDDFLGSRSNGAIAHYVIYGSHEQRLAYDLDGAQLNLGYAL